MMMALHSKDHVAFHDALKAWKAHSDASDNDGTMDEDMGQGDRNPHGEVHSDGNDKMKRSQY